MRIQQNKCYLGLISLLSMLAIGLLASGCEFGPEEHYRSPNAASQNQLKQLGLVFKIYANESAGEHFPPLSPDVGHLMFAVTSLADGRDGLPMQVYPTYLVDTTVLISPGATDAGMWEAKAESNPISVIGDQHYVYLGYLVQDDAAMDAFTESYLDAVVGGGVPSFEFENAEQPIYRLREGVESLYATESSASGEAWKLQSKIPVVVERRVWPDGNVNVLYMDGHVERLSPGQFPNTDSFWANVARINEKK